MKMVHIWCWNTFNMMLLFVVSVIIYVYITINSNQQHNIHFSAFKCDINDHMTWRIATPILVITIAITMISHMMIVCLYSFLIIIMCIIMYIFNQHSHSFLELSIHSTIIIPMSTQLLQDSYRHHHSVPAHAIHGQLRDVSEQTQLQSSHSILLDTFDVS